MKIFFFTWVIQANGEKDKQDDTKYILKSAMKGSQRRCLVKVF